jgi:hypothetical protein
LAFVEPIDKTSSSTQDHLRVEQTVSIEDRVNAQTILRHGRQLLDEFMPANPARAR